MRSQTLKGAVLVLGMHRSGTSALTRGLEVLGVDLGANLKEPVAGDNEKGFFEDWELSTINDDLLALSGGRWDSLFTKSAGEDGDARVNALKLRAIAAITERFGASPHFGFKDPRTCRTLPFWKDVIAKLGIRGYYVIAFRNPMSVAQSLAARDGFTHAKSYYLWLLHMLNAVRHTEGEARIFIDFDELVAEPETVLERVAALIGDVHAVVSEPALKAYSRDFLDPKLRRNRAQPAYLALDPACSPMVKAAYDLLQREAAGLRADESREAWSPLLAAFASVSPHLDQLDLFDRDLRATTAALIEKDVALGRAVQTAESWHAEHDRLLAETENLRTEHQATRDEAEAAQVARENENTRFASALAERDGAILHLQSAARAHEEALRALEQNQGEALRRLEAHHAAQLAARDESYGEALEQHTRAHEEALRTREHVHEQGLRRLEQAALEKLRDAERHVRREREAREAEAARFAEMLESEREVAEAALAEISANAEAEQRSLEQELAALHRETERRAQEYEALLRLETERGVEAQTTALAAQGAQMARASMEQLTAYKRSYEALAQRLREVYGSTSWRVAWPMRALKHGLAGQPAPSERIDPAPEIYEIESSVAAASPARVAISADAAPRRRIHFTICAKNYLAIARTCLESSRAAHPEAEHYLVLCDEVDQGYDPRKETFEVIPARDVAVPCFEDMALRYDVMELNTAVKPFCFTHFFNAGGDEVVYLDPDLYFLTPLEEVRRAFDGGAEAVLTPHITAPIEDDKHPSDLDILRGGTYNLGFLALKNAAAPRRFVHWWGERLRTGAVSDIARGLFTDQRWCDLLPSFVPKAAVLEHPGYNLAYWNLMHRPVSETAGQWTAAGAPLSFVHFSGASFVDPNVFSKHQNRYDANGIGPLRKLYDRYRDEVRARGFGSSPSYAYSFNLDADGAFVSPILRALYRNEWAQTPRNEPDWRGFLAYAYAPSPELPQDGAVVSRVLHLVWKLRPDLQAVFDLSDSARRAAFLDWCLHSTKRDYNLDAGVAASPGGAPEAERPAPIAAVSRAMLANYSRLRPIYRHLPVELRGRVRGALARAAFPSGRSVPQRVESASPGPGAALIGYARGELGMGEHVRMTAACLQAQGVPMGVVNISDSVVARQEDRRYDHLLDEGANYRANIFHVNADQLPIVCAKLGDRFMAGKKNIAYPFWELGAFPGEWLPQLNAMDEVWAPSHFIEDALKKSIERPVVHMPVAVELAPGYEKWRRADFGLPEEAFVFLFYFDLASFASRKNPMGVIEAYEKAVRGRAPDREPLLVVKVISADRYPVEFERLKEIVASTPGVVLMPETISADQIHGLVNCSDAFLSLHRSEGFGRGPAEAMRLGKVAIATAFSGNMDYMNHENSFPVRYRLREVGDEYPHGAGQQWADPDIDQAAFIMRRLMNEPELAPAVGARARAYMAEHHTQSRLGRLYAERLHAIGALG